MKMKKVVYNGGTEKYMNQICNEPTDLVKGAVYTVSREYQSDWHTEYKLAGIKGTFNSTWFNEQESYVAVAESLPVVGKPLYCKRIQNGKLEPVKTSKTVDFVELGGGVYLVETVNRFYYVSIQK